MLHFPLSLWKRVVELHSAKKQKQIVSIWQTPNKAVIIPDSAENMGRRHAWITINMQELFIYMYEDT